MTTLRRTSSCNDIGADLPSPRPPVSSFARLPSFRSSGVASSRNSLDSWDEAGTTASTPVVRLRARVPSFSHSLATPRHRHSVSELSGDRLRLRALELDLPHLAERVRLAQQRIESTQRAVGITDVAAVRERDEALDALVEFRMLSARVPATPKRRPGRLQPVPFRVGFRLLARGAGADDASLLAKLS